MNFYIITGLYTNYTIISSNKLSFVGIDIIIIVVDHARIWRRIAGLIPYFATLIPIFAALTACGNLTKTCLPADI